MTAHRLRPGLSVRGARCALLLSALAMGPWIVGCQLPTGGAGRSTTGIGTPPYLRLEQGQRHLEVRDGARINVKREPFALVFPLRHYRDEPTGWHSVRIACSDRGDLLTVKPGARIDQGSRPPMPFAPGRGLAAHGPYEVFLLDSDAHHYIVYQPGNRSAQRAIAVRSLGTHESEVRVAFKAFRLDERDYPLAKVPSKEVHLVVFMDHNLNRVMDTGELFRFTLVLR